MALSFGAEAQEIEVPLNVDFQLNKSYEKRIASSSKTSVVSLPFLDDFSSDKTFANPDGNEVLWEESCARLNETYAIDAPTLGVMTFDGLRCDGYPYNFESANDYGVADTLESVEIDLFTASGGVVMSFLYQAEGRGNRPEGADSLVLEFFEPDSNRWNWAWSSPGRALHEFEQVLISIEDIKYLKPNFKFRFKNYATLSGALDHWHIDYVEIDDNRSLNDTILEDHAFFEPQHSLTDIYSSVPWSHFDPQLMKSDILLQVKNNSAINAFQGNNVLEIFESGILQDSYINPTDPSIAAGATQAYNYNLADAGIEYDSGLPGPVNFDVSFSFAVSPDFITDNNTLSFTQRFDDYYAFDDGSAERGYGVDDAGGQVAYKFDFIQSDSISALYMYFLPVAEDPSDEQFFLTIWSHNEGVNCPDTIIHQDNIAAPSFTDYQVANDYFLVYPLQEKVFVESGQTVWIGWQQSGETSLNIGNDKNTNNNADRLKFNVGQGWNASTISGSLMIRPAVGEIPVVGIEEFTEQDILIFPNPSNGELFFDLPQLNDQWSYEVFMNSGSMVAKGAIENSYVNLSELNEGMYWIRLFNPYLERPLTKKFILVR